MFFFSNCHTCCHYLVHHLARIHRTLIVGRSTRFVSAICRGFDFSTLKKNQQQEEKEEEEEEERKKKLVKLRLIAWILTSLLRILKENWFSSSASRFQRNEIDYACDDFSRENENEKLSRSKRLKWKNDREKWEKNKRKFVYWNKLTNTTNNYTYDNILS